MGAMIRDEIRDKETAEIATHAALTGHLVLSTLHTNDAPSAITRLVDLGVAPYLVASTVEAVLAQRLVRVLCTHCRQPMQPTAEQRAVLGDDTSVICTAVGCGRCGAPASAGGRGSTSWCGWTTSSGRWSSGSARPERSGSWRRPRGWARSGTTGSGRCGMGSPRLKRCSG